MLSHHAPPKRLLQSFANSQAHNAIKLWVYSRAKARPIFKVTAESAERGYFGDDPFGRSEEQIDLELNERYEAPFNRILLSLTLGLAPGLDSSLIEVCANYMAGLFLRSKPMREATKIYTRAFDERFSSQIGDSLTLRRYAAKVSLHTSTEVPLDTILRTSRQWLSTEEASETAFFQSATTEFSQLPARLREAHWAICFSPHLELLQSDAAVALLNVSSTGQVQFGTGIKKQGSQWFLPISPRLALRASAEYLSESTLTFERANQVNSFLIRAAHSFVYSSVYEPEIEVFTREHLYSLRYFRDLLQGDIKSAVQKMIGGVVT